MKTIFSKSLFFLVSLFFIVSSCSKSSLNDEEKDIVQKFLMHKWGDIQFSVFSGETIPHEFYLTFSFDGKNLKYKREENYFASFGNKEFLNEGEVDLYYDNKEERITIELLNEKGEIFETCYVRVKRENLLSLLNQQISYRSFLNKDLSKRLNDDNEYGQWSLRGVFSSKMENMRQSQDFSLNYSHVELSHFDNFTPLLIEGLASKSGQEYIFWNLIEVYTGPVRPKKSVESSLESTDSLSSETTLSEPVENNSGVVKDEE